MNLRDFPADKQVLSVRLVAAGQSSDEVKLVASPDVEHGISSELSVADFTVTASDVIVEPNQPIASAPAVASISSRYFVSRKTGYFVVKMIVPLILIVMMSWSVFWIDPVESGTQIGVATTTMLTLIAYRFAIDALLPKISYLTRLDTFVLAATVLVFLSLFEVIATSRMAKTGLLERALKTDRWSRVIFPSAFVTLLVFTLT